MSSVDIDFSIPSAEDLKNQKTEYDKSPLADGVYICRINKVELRKSPTYVNGRPDYNQLKLGWQAVLSPVKQLSGDPLINVKGATVPALSSLIWKNANPFAMGMKQDGTPSNLRALFAYGLGVQVDGEFKVSKIVVLDKNEEEVDSATAKAYAEEFVKLRAGTIQPNEAKLRNEGYKHIPDLAVIEGNYISVNLAVDGDYNKVTGLSKAPMSFNKAATDTELEEGIKKFNDVIYPKIVENRKTRANAGVSSSETISSSFTAVTEESIDLSDIPF